MIRTESGCVDCGLPCLHESCPHYEYVVYECDNCGDETNLYWFDNQQLCIDCIIKQLEEVCYDE